MIWALRIFRGGIVFLAIFAMVGCMFPSWVGGTLHSLAGLVGGIGWALILFTGRVLARVEIEALERKRLARFMATNTTCWLGDKGCGKPGLKKCTQHGIALMGDEDNE